MLYNIVPAEKKDFNFLYRLLKETMKEYYIQTYNIWNEKLEKEYFIEDFNKLNYQLIIKENEKIGGLVLTENKNEIFINEIQILPKYQNKGIGKAILQEIISKSEKIGKPIKLEVLKVNLKAQNLYRGLGFIQSGKTATHYQLLRECKNER